MSGYGERIHRGLPIDEVEIIDLHAHLGPTFNMHIPAADAPAMIRLMDICGIDKAVVSATLSWDSDFVLGNNMMLDAVGRYPGRLYGACAVNGNYPELSLAELERTLAHKAVVMAKIHPVNTKCRLDDRRMSGIFELASKKRLLLLVHTWLDDDPYGNLDLFAAAARRYPDVKWVMGHSGGPHGSIRAVELARRLKNVFLDITLSMCPARQIEFFVRKVGSGRVLFGTDNPFIDPRPQIGRVGLAEISDEDKINIFGANARRLIAFDT